MFISVDQLIAAYRKIGFDVTRRTEEQVTFKRGLDKAFHATMVTEGVEVSFVLHNAALLKDLPGHAQELEQAILAVQNETGPLQN